MAQRAFSSPKEFAEITGLHENSVLNHCRAGIIPHVRVGRRILIPNSVVERWKAVGDREQASDQEPAAVAA